jgi:hypothetical protein
LGIAALYEQFSNVRTSELKKALKYATWHN